MINILKVSIIETDWQSSAGRLAFIFRLMTTLFNKITNRVRIQVIFCIATFIAVYTFANLHPPPAMAISQISNIEVNVHKGSVSINVENASLREILLRISDEAGIRLVLYGGLQMPITQSFSNVPLTEGIRRLVGNHSVAILQRMVAGPDARKVLQDIVEVWVVDTAGSEKVSRITDSEPEKLKSVPQANISKNSIQNNESQPNISDIREKIQTQHQFEEDTEVGYWARILVTNHDRTIREQAITELERIGSEPAVAAIAIMIGDDDAQIRRHAVESLGNMDNDHTTPLVGQALIGDKDPSVRITAVRFFASQQNEISRAFLTTALKDTDKLVKALASKALSVY